VKIVALTLSVLPIVLMAPFAMLSASPATAQPSLSSATCSIALRDAQNRITQGRNVRTVAYEVDMTGWYTNAPAERPDGYIFALGGPAAESILNSTQFMQAISADIIGRCPSVSLVKFTLEDTDWVVAYGLTALGRVSLFECVEMREEAYVPPEWGTEVCL
jgi:hypothetical protein